MKTTPLFTSIALSLVFTSTAMAELVIFPANGQSNEQLAQDKNACYDWAKNNSNYDPNNPPVIQQQGAPQQDAAGNALRGAAGGAAAGAIIGAIAGDAGKGAAIGAATVGGARGIGARRSNRAAQQQAQQQTQQQAGQIAQLQAGYDKSYAACLEGKGYSVK